MTSVLPWVGAPIHAFKATVKLLAQAWSISQEDASLTLARNSNRLLALIRGDYAALTASRLVKVQAVAFLAAIISRRRIACTAGCRSSSPFMRSF